MRATTTAASPPAEIYSEALGLWFVVPLIEFVGAGNGADAGYLPAATRGGIDPSAPERARSSGAARSAKRVEEAGHHDAALAGAIARHLGAPQRIVRLSQNNGGEVRAVMRARLPTKAASPDEAPVLSCRVSAALYELLRVTTGLGRGRGGRARAPVIGGGAPEEARNSRLGDDRTMSSAPDGAKARRKKKRQRLVEPLVAPPLRQRPHQPHAQSQAKAKPVHPPAAAPGGGAGGDTPAGPGAATKPSEAGSRKRARMPKRGGGGPSERGGGRGGGAGRSRGGGCGGSGGQGRGRSGGGGGGGRSGDGGSAEEEEALWSPDESLDPAALARLLEPLEPLRPRGGAADRPPPDDTSSEPADEIARAAALGALRQRYLELYRKYVPQQQQQPSPSGRPPPPPSGPAASPPVGSFEKWHFHWLHEVFKQPVLVARISCHDGRRSR